MVKLTPTMRDALIVSGVGAMHSHKGYYGNQPHFHQTDRRSGLPNLKQETVSCRALLRLELIAVNFDTHPAVTLTEAGQKAFEAAITEPERQAWDYLRAEVQRLAESAAKRSRVEAWRRENEGSIEAHRRRLRVLHDEQRDGRHRVDEIAYLLGRGANDVDALLSELRNVVSRLDALVSEIRTAEAERPTFPEG